VDIAEGNIRVNRFEPSSTHTDELVHELSTEEGWAMLDRQARRYLNMSAEDFIAAWESGAFDDDPDRPEVMRVALLIPFAR
jgi:hypothetical protein